MRAVRFGMSEDRPSQMRAESNAAWSAAYEAKYGEQTRRRDAENAEIVALWKSGETWAAIGRRFDITGKVAKDRLLTTLKRQPNSSEFAREIHRLAVTECENGERREVVAAILTRTAESVLQWVSIPATEPHDWENSIEASVRTTRVVAELLGKPLVPYPDVPEVTWQELSTLTRDQVKAVKGAGKATLDEIADILKRHGIDW